MEKKTIMEIRNEILKILTENKVSKAHFKDISEFICECYDVKAYFENKEA